MIFEYDIKVVKYVFVFVHGSIKPQQKIRKCLNNLHSIFQNSAESSLSVSDHLLHVEGGSTVVPCEHGDDTASTGHYTEMQ